MSFNFKLIVEDKLTPRLKHKISIYPRIAYPHFIHPSVRIIEQVTTPFVPVNSTPPPEYDGYGKPGGKFFAGNLQAGFYEQAGRVSLIETTGIFGYSAIDTWKQPNEQYAGYQHDKYLEHESRYPGHEPRSKYLSWGMEVSKEFVMDYLAKQYGTFLRKM